MIFQPNKIIFHHTGDSYNGRQFNKVNEYHKTKKFPPSALGYFCGYHFFIERDGSVIVARSLDEVGAHTLGENWEAYGICLAGNFDVEQPTAAQKEALGKWCDILMKWLKISITQIYPHRAFRPTSCPGDNVPDKYAAYAVIESQITIIKKAILWLQNFLRK